MAAVNGTISYADGDYVGSGKSVVGIGFGFAGIAGEAVGAVGAIAYGGTSAVINYVSGAYKNTVGRIVDGVCSCSGC